MYRTDSRDYKSSCTNPKMGTCLYPGSIGPIIYAVAIAIGSSYEIMADYNGYRSPGWTFMGLLGSSWNLEKFK